MHTLQAKRYKDAVGVHHIRELAGAIEEKKARRRRGRTLSSQGAGKSPSQPIGGRDVCQLTQLVAKHRSVADCCAALALLSATGEEETKPMAALSIRDLDDSVKEKLRLRAARHGRSMEAEIRLILTAAATEDERPHNDLFGALTERLKQLGGADLDLPARSTPPRAADFSE